MSNIFQAKLELENILLNEKGISGIGIQKGKIVIYTEKFLEKRVLQKIPLKISGIPVVIKVSGRFYALQNPVIFRQSWLPGYDPTETDWIAIDTNRDLILNGFGNPENVAANASPTAPLFTLFCYTSDGKEVLFTGKKDNPEEIYICIRQISSTWWEYWRFQDPNLEAEISSSPIEPYASNGQEIYGEPIPEAVKDRRTQWRPSIGGVSIGHYSITAGTLGAVVFDNATNKKLILSNNHVLAASDSIQNSRANKNDAIYQPGVHDGGTSADTLATLERWVKLDEEGNNFVDAALGKPINENDLAYDMFEIGSVYGISDAKEGMIVKKSGRTSSFNYGKIVDINANVNVYYNGFTIKFRDQIITENIITPFIIPMLWPGDSGSLLLDNSNKAVGLGFAGSGINSVFNKISNIMNSLDIHFEEEPIPEKATLIIDTTPIKGEIFVDSVSWGIAPQTRELNAGNYTISFGNIPNYTTPISVNITLSGGENRQIIGEYNEIPPEKATITVNSTPVESNIYLNDNYLGKTNNSFEIDPGTYNLKLTKSKYKDYIEDFSINKGETKTFNIILSKKFPYWMLGFGLLAIPLLKRKK